MGYDVHITRRQDWWEEGEEISIEEWAAYIESDPDMRMENSAEKKTPDGSTIRIESKGLSIWTSYSGHGENGNMAWFDFRDGRITVKNPDKEILGKMYSIASAFEAKVQGDEGEVYDANGNPQEPTHNIRSFESVGKSKKPWWKFWA